MIGEGDLFEDGYDSDGKIGPFSDAILLEGEQDFDEDQLGTEADGYGDIDGDGDGDSSGDSKEEEEEEFDHTENLNAIKAMELKKVKLELYLRLEISLGKKVELQERLLEAICLKKTRYEIKAAVKLARLAAKAEKRTNKKQKEKKKKSEKSTRWAEDLPSQCPLERTDSKHRNSGGTIKSLIQD